MKRSILIILSIVTTGIETLRCQEDNRQRIRKEFREDPQSIKEDLKKIIQAYEDLNKLQDDLNEITGDLNKLKKDLASQKKSLGHLGTGLYVTEGAIDITLSYLMQAVGNLLWDGLSHPILGIAFGQIVTAGQAKNYSRRIMSHIKPSQSRWLRIGSANNFSGTNF